MLLYEQKMNKLNLHVHSHFRDRKDLDKTRIKSDEDAVVEVIHTIDAFVNPFENDHTELVHLASGKVATNAVASDMTNMFERGEKAALDFMNTKVLCSKPDIYAAIKKTNLKTFSQMSTKVNSKNRKGDVVAVKNSKKLFAKMLLIARSRDVDMKEVLQYSLRPFPLPLATSDGNLVKTAKSKLLHLIENRTTDHLVDRIEGDKVLILDAMAILHTIKIIPSTFGELAHKLLVMVVELAVKSKAKRVDFVCDRYPAQSIKDFERAIRGERGTQLIKIYSSLQKVPRQWKKFITAGENKEELIKFIFKSWSEECDPQLLRGVEVFIAHESQCHQLVASTNTIACHEVEDLACGHEEADTRMLAHAKSASAEYSSIIIKSPDTDVFIIALNASLSIRADLYFETGTKDKRRIISISKVKENLGDLWSAALIGFHSFTGNTFNFKFAAQLFSK
jgi:hypothetical protein